MIQTMKLTLYSVLCWHSHCMLKVGWLSWSTSRTLGMIGGGLCRPYALPVVSMLSSWSCAILFLTSLLLIFSVQDVSRILHYCLWRDVTQHHRGGCSCYLLLFQVSAQLVDVLFSKDMILKLVSIVRWFIEFVDIIIRSIECDAV